ncbi:MULTISPECIES: MarR family winged helix-turn-helix transcriptional regulator [Clostridium]|uniref:MarR family winged helix-turn-helix transcriptional regulator n=1 Tax=Clostridium TaxID=1485 RepID=UPI001FA78E53|nr:MULTISPECIES: MarR family winged helix-turn-helix transcriptional regulator [Clostridium]
MSQNKSCAVRVLQIMLDEIRIIEEQKSNEFEIPVVQVHAIFEIGKSNDISMSELSRAVYLDKTTTNKIVNNLVDEKFVLRHIHPEDKRHVIIKLTENGQKIYKGICEDFSFYCKNILDSIPKENKRSMMENFDVLMESIKNNSNSY